MSIPSPADLAARRPAPKPAPPRTTTPAVTAPKTETRPPLPRPRPAAEEAIAPGKLEKKEHFRKYFLFGLRLNGMHPHARLVGHDLMWRANHATGQISPNAQPTVQTLALATGLAQRQVEVALANLQSRGWLHYRRVQEGPRAGAQAMSLAIPAAALEHIRTQIRDKPTDGYRR